jgi:hypothetical protein
MRKIFERVIYNEIWKDLKYRTVLPIYKISNYGRILNTITIKKN